MWQENRIQRGILDHLIVRDNVCRRPDMEHSATRLLPLDTAVVESTDHTLRIEKWTCKDVLTWKDVGTFILPHWIDLGGPTYIRVQFIRGPSLLHYVQIDLWRQREEETFSSEHDPIVVRHSSRVAAAVGQKRREILQQLTRYYHPWKGI